MNLRDPIATLEQMKHALLQVRDKHLPASHLVMLKAQCNSPGGIITATKLAQAAGFENFNGANLQYGTLGSHLAVALNYQPPKRRDGTSQWWTALSYSVDGEFEEGTAHFQFVMRPELMQALRDMKWCGSV